MNEKNSLILIFCAAFFALIFAYISQYFFDYQPCILCLYQRLPFLVICALSGFALVVKKFRRIVLFSCLALLLINCLIAIYHVGVEQKIFVGPTTCSSANLDDFDNLEDLTRAISQTKAVRCDEPQFIFLNLSMAAWNLIYCAILALYFLLNLQSRTNRFRAVGQK